MKRIFALAALAAVLAPGAALAQGPYAEFSLGSGIGGQVENEFGIVLDDFDVEPGFLVSGAGGFEFASGFRLEGEIIYFDNKLDTENDPFLQKLHMQGGALLGNVVFAPDLGLMVRPYVGVGVGAAVAEIQDTFLGVRSKADDDGVAWQVKAGAEVDITDRVALTGGYKYLNVLTEDDGDEVDGFFHAASVGIRFRPNPR
jgi:opacity protein-like surface antigen